ncbi:MAG: signal recognition particle-docking protein FtsY [Paludibacteraceae bacterium]|nr:signal recognition particle-docking protein FtsY [Paludibacteraceae bacterium]
MGFFGLFGKKGNVEQKDETSKAKEQERLSQGLEKTKRGLMERLQRVLTGRSKIDDEVLDTIEESLLGADVGVETTVKIIEAIERRAKEDRYTSEEELKQIIRSETSRLFKEKEQTESVETNEGKRPYVIMVVGVNGVGKTTTIGKLANRYKQAGMKVVLGAADTFRAAATEQLTIWADRVGVGIVKQGQGADPASVAFDTVKSAIAQDADVVIIDTAGRLHNKVGLMDELSKIKKVMGKVREGAPDEVLLVLDGSTGQNAKEQAKEFVKATTVTGLVITKLDGTAKGGVVIGISAEMDIPVRWIGVGEGMDDLQEFDADKFVATLFA